MNNLFPAGYMNNLFPVGSMRFYGEMKKVTLDEIRAMQLLGVRRDLEILIYNMEVNGWFFVYQNERGRFFTPDRMTYKGEENETETPTVGDPCDRQP